MEKRRIDSLDVDVSLLGFGLMRLPVINNVRANIDYETGRKMVEMAFKGGINYFDTGYFYHEKQSEVFIGTILSEYPRDSYYLATKMPIVPAVGSAAEMKDIFALQLKQCKVDYFDFYLVHSMQIAYMQQFYDYRVYDFLKQKKAEGKIRRLGFSFHDGVPLLTEILDKHDWDFVQIQLNYLDWEPMNCKSFYEIITERKLPIAVMEPVKGGVLIDLGEKAGAIFKKARPNASFASWALRFPASLPNVMCVLSGMSTPEHMAENIKTFSPFVPLSQEEYKIIEEAATAYRASGTIPCTGCRYCMDCPTGLDIPRVFSHYNFYQLTKNEILFGNHYRSLLDSEKAHNCVACGKCSPLCPQHIDIPKYMKEIAEFTG